MDPQPNSLEALKSKLDEHYTWPCVYPFKFIVREERVEQVKQLFPEEAFSCRPSAKGTYVGMTLEKQMQSSDEVLAVYQKASQVPDLLAL